MTRETQAQRLLKALENGQKVTQIDLKYYLDLRNNNAKTPKSDIVDAIAELGIANLPARISDLKAEGYKIKTENIKIKGRFCKTHYAIYSLISEDNGE